MIRCKFVCNHITEYTASYQYSLSAVFGGDENKVYWESTPAGSFQVTINSSKGKLFEVGKQYFIDITEAV